MGNFFIVNDTIGLTPLLVGHNANTVIAEIIARLALASAMTGGVVAETTETFDADASRVSLFGDIATGKVSAAEATSLLKAIDAAEKDAAKASRAPAAQVLLNGEPALPAEVKRAFRGAVDGRAVVLESLCGEHTVGLSMFRI